MTGSIPSVAVAAGTGVSPPPVGSSGVTRPAGSNEERRPHRRAVGSVSEPLDPEELARLLHEYHETGDRRLRNRIVESQMRLVEHYVIRFRRSSRSSPEDLRQTALLALIGAVDRFDESEGASLATFASRTIEGELKRYLRDRTWMVRPPRATQEAHLAIRQATEELSHQLHRSPTVADLGARLDMDEETIIQGLVAATTRESESLNRPKRDDDGLSPEDAISAEDAELDLTEQRMVLRLAVESLEQRHLHILRLRYIEELSQPEIAARIGVSQSYVSRLLRDGLAALRREFER